MNKEAMRARMQRLAELVAGLGQEESLWRKCNECRAKPIRWVTLRSIGMMAI